jgi:hypothetical protein
MPTPGDRASAWAAHVVGDKTGIAEAEAEAGQGRCGTTGLARSSVRTTGLGHYGPVGPS